MTVVQVATHPACYTMDKEKTQAIQSLAIKFLTGFPAEGETAQVTRLPEPRRGDLFALEMKVFVEEDVAAQRRQELEDWCRVHYSFFSQSYVVGGQGNTCPLAISHPGESK